MWKSLSFLWRYSWKVQKNYNICLVLYQFTSALTPILIMIFPKVIIDELMNQNRKEVLIGLILFFVSSIFISKILSSVLENMAFYKRCIILEQFQIELGQHLMKSDLESLENPEFLDLKQNAEKFLYANGRGFSFVLDSAVNIIGKIFVFGTIFTILLTLNPMVLIVFVLLAVCNSYAQMKLKRRYAELEIEKNPRERRLLYLMTLFSDVKYAKELRINGEQALFIHKLRDVLQNLWKFYKKQMYLNNISQFFLHAMDGLQRCFAYFYMIYIVTKDLISIGDFTLYVNAVGTFNDAMNDVLDNLNNIRQYSIYFESVEQYLNLPINIDVDKKDFIPFPSEIKSIEFKDVSFRYVDRDVYALKNVNVKFHMNEKVAIVGENGAGKTTFIKLLCRLYEPTEGMILINGIDIRAYSYKEYKQQISAIFQDFQLFSFDVAENIALKENVDIERINQSLSRIDMLDRISSLNKGLYTQVHKDYDVEGFEPSGGQAQKLAIARALYKNSPMIILDEPTAALDPRAEYEIYKTFATLVENKLAIYISHRLSSTRFCDRILVLEKGRLVEEGIHDQLMKNQGLYYELYSMQSKYYIDKDS